MSNIAILLWVSSIQQEEVLGCRKEALERGWSKEVPAAAVGLGKRSFIYFQILILFL